MQRLVLLPNRPRVIARLNADGSRDTNFAGGPYPLQGIRAVAVQPDQNILLGGKALDETPRRAVLRLRPDGTIDTTFVPQLEGDDGIPVEVNTLLLQPDGTILVGSGRFESAAAPLHRLNPDESQDKNFQMPTFWPLPPINPRPTVQGIARQPDGMIVIAGWFLGVNNIDRAGLARLNPYGSVDTGFARLGSFSRTTLISPRSMTWSSSRTVNY